MSTKYVLPNVKRKNSDGRNNKIKIRGINPFLMVGIGRRVG